MSTFKRLAILIFMFFALTANSQALGQLFRMNHPMLGQTAPDFTLKTVQGNTVNMSTYRAGKPVIVFFWATWCPHCRQQISRLHKRIPELERAGIRVIIIDIQESAKKVQGYLERNRIKADICLDTQGTVSDQYGILGIPAYFLIDNQGTVRAVKNTFPSNYSGLLASVPDMQTIPFGQSAPEKAGINN